jgi:hypothetical protein
MLEHGDDLLLLYQLAYALFLPAFQRQLLVGAARESISDGLTAAMRSRLEFETRSRSLLPAISVMEQRLFLGERLLRDTDATSMSASIEVRLPLVDQVLLEQVTHLHNRERYLPLRRKSILRRTGLGGLDPALFTGAKTGFVLPYDKSGYCALPMAVVSRQRPWTILVARLGDLRPDLVVPSTPSVHLNSANPAVIAEATSQKTGCLLTLKAGSPGNLC